MQPNQAVSIPVTRNADRYSRRPIRVTGHQSSLLSAHFAARRRRATPNNPSNSKPSPPELAPTPTPCATEQPPPLAEGLRPPSSPGLFFGGTVPPVAVLPAMPPLPALPLLVVVPVPPSSGAPPPLTYE